MGGVNEDEATTPAPRESWPVRPFNALVGHPCRPRYPLTDEPMITDHLPPEALAAYLAEGARAPGFDRVQAHLADCPECREEASAVSRILRADGRSHQVRRVMMGVGSVAAVLAIGIWFAAPRPPSNENVTRGTEPRLPSGEPDVTAIAPLGEVAPVAGQVSFSWHVMPDAVEYRLTLSDAGGGPIWKKATTDTVLVLPLEVSLARGTTYYWYVDALLSDGRSLTTGAREFRLGP